MSESTDQQSQLLPDKEKQPKKDKWTLLFLNTWSFEILSIVFTAACFITLCCLLLIYNLKRSPDLPQGLTLNSIVSVLATAAKSSLLFSISNAIGQLKWIWFRQGKRQLYDMQAVDDASRGPLGSLSILFQRQHPGGLLLSLGAMVTIISLAFDPFVQQIVSYPVRQVISPSDVATMKQARFPLSAENTGADVDDAFDHAMHAGLWSDNFILDPTCPSGNCTWPVFLSAGWCSKCEDVTSTARLVGCTDPVDLNASSNGTQSSPCSIDLSHGTASDTPLTIQPYNFNFGSTGPRPYTIEVPSEAIWAVNYEDQIGLVSRTNSTYLGVQDPLVVLAHAELDLPFDKTTTFVPVHAEQNLTIRRVTECVISMCARNNNVSVSRGVFSNNMSSVDFGHMFYRNFNATAAESPDNRFAAYGQKPCWKPIHGLANNNDSDAISNPDDFQLCLDSYNAQFTSFKELFTLSATYTLLAGDGDHWSMIEQPLGPNLKRVKSAGLEAIMSNIANSLTKYAYSISNDTVAGEVRMLEVYVAVDWRFLALPLRSSCWGLHSWSAPFV
ncbi:DUF3176 domain-containing protein [Aspergillus novofumigatus IBT 16806]|uniref:Uncharacterized protein n=1 Tax=Aspergillus novofumigatus (strain IBT 16806) TaxID=1392255 RepID=A0A2I1BXI8_ASPN1|nr:uncharacterized protein P174DRAFT_434507 [Aspergillus novofumigatus IBT 16806]PKX90088.1 hypothetical protein P174DRAFT_434507 [Aspergillus novofumigatus IBT 16806]